MQTMYLAVLEKNLNELIKKTYGGHTRSHQSLSRMDIVRNYVEGDSYGEPCEGEWIAWISMLSFMLFFHSQK